MLRNNLFSLTRILFTVKNKNNKKKVSFEITQNRKMAGKDFFKVCSAFREDSVLNSKWRAAKALGTHRKYTKRIVGYFVMFKKRAGVFYRV